MVYQGFHTIEEENAADILVETYLSADV